MFTTENLRVVQAVRVLPHMVCCAVCRLYGCYDRKCIVVQVARIL